MKKIVAIILVLMMSCFIFAGCSETEEIEPKNIPQRFVAVESEDKFGGHGVYDATVYADKETGVMYLALNGDRRLGVTVLLNSDGTPMLYDFEKSEVVKK